MTRQSDLFAAALLPGLATAEDILTPDEEVRLIRSIGDVELAPFRFQGWLGKRQTNAFGWHYDFDNAGFQPTQAIPDFLLPLRERAARFAGLAPDDLEQLLLTRYDPGAGIGWHRDRPVFEHVVGISLGAPAVLRFRRRDGTRFDRASLPLPPRSIYHLSGPARYEWEHSIAPIDAPRWSVTFRSLSDKGRLKARGSASAG